MSVQEVEQKESWLEDRRRGIGGSDWVDVLGLEPYGCPRRLWYDKRGQPADFGQVAEPEGYLIRGQKLEQVIADEVAEKMSRTVRRPGKLAELNLPEWWIGNPDRMIASSGPDDPEGPGVLEIKTMNPWLFRRLRTEGAKLYHLAQTHHYLGLSGWKWGMLWVKEPVSWKDYVVTVARDAEMLLLMQEKGDLFWSAVQDQGGTGPERLKPRDPRCQECRFRWTCQEEALVGTDGRTPGQLVEMEDWDLATLVEQEREIHALKAEVEEQHEQLKQRIKDRLGAPMKVELPNGRRIYWTEYTTNRLDGHALKSAHPDIAEAFTRPTPSSSLRIY